ncbi:MAG: hypothetical protein IT531_03245 [Burkholderiales bacterium]|nr:hypothetical protein [Burkholderiales bacterium]
MTPIDPAELASRLLADPNVGWSIGLDGAIAEFYWRADEPHRHDEHGIVSERGAIALTADAAWRVFAREQLAHDWHGWSATLAFCLPAEQAAMRGHQVITEIAPPADRPGSGAGGSSTFDLGIGGRYYSLCVRAAAGECASILRQAQGQNLLASPAVMRALVAASPDRVFESRLARIEVRQPIASAGAASPEGPHTHVLPHLLANTEPTGGHAPAGWVAQVVAYPAHPLMDLSGHTKPFDRALYDAFDAWLALYGDPAQRAHKDAVMAAVRSGLDPQSTPTALLATASTELTRIALRQLRHLDGETPALDRWSQALDRD